MLPKASINILKNTTTKSKTAREISQEKNNYKTKFDHEENNI